MLLVKILICLAVVVVAAAIMYLKQKHEAYKFKQQEEFARTIGLRYHGGALDGMYSRYCGFRLIFNRRNVGIYNLFSAETEDLRISVFELGFETGKKYSQNKGRIICQTVVAISAKKFNFPNFVLEPDNILPDQCRDFFAPELVDFVSRRREFEVEGFETRMLMYHPGKTVPQSDYRRLVEEGFEVFQMLNEYASPEKIMAPA